MGEQEAYCRGVVSVSRIAVSDAGDGRWAREAAYLLLARTVLRSRKLCAMDGGWGMGGVEYGGVQSVELRVLCRSTMAL